ncbi:MAG: DUF1579 family protein [Phycisphaeraceae bacterium]|nr:DUF1579 family protein [Phycisphaerales bacterium]MCB9860030.1 DUF1579 family protein [Phycisphaeraceae bacterium]
MARTSGNGNGLLVLGLAAGLVVGVGGTMWLTSSNAHAAQPEMKADGGQPDAMDAEALMQPNEHHKKLEKHVGTWRTEGWFIMDDPTQRIPINGTSVQTMEMDGRYIFTKFTGDEAPDGSVFRGAGVLGYDNVKQMYFGSWLDNMGTGMMVQYGNMTDDGEIVVEGDFEYAPGEIMTMCNRTKFLDDNTYVESFFMVVGGDEVMQLGELKNTRK